MKVRRIAGAGIVAVGLVGLALPQMGSADKNETVEGSTYEVAMSAITGGDYHTCALLTTGTVQCWGRNSFGQLGNGNTTSPQLLPVNVSGLTGVKAISAGAQHTCALLDTNGVKCWGWDFAGQLGNGAGGSSSTPVDVVGLTSGVASVSAGDMHTCAVLLSGALKCWGSDMKGQIGNGPFDTADVQSPEQIIASGVLSVSAGYRKTCAVLVGGEPKCWGSNEYGSIGDGDATGGGTNTRTVPTSVTGLTSGVGVMTVDGDVTCAMLSVGGVKCWGHNNFGQLGDGGPLQNSVATPRTLSITTAVAISTGADTTCALLSSGEATCWGANGFGQAGDGTTGLKASPTVVPTLGTSVIAITSGGNHTCAIVTGGTVKCWGDNSFGQLGDNSTSPRTSPTDVSGLSAAVGVTTTTTTTAPPGGTGGGGTGGGGTGGGGSGGGGTGGTAVTDPTIHSTPPQEVANNSSIIVLTPKQKKTQKLQSNTPDVCLPTDDDIVFIDTGRCDISILGRRSGDLLRRYRTTVVGSSIVELGIGNQTATLAPIYFDNGSARLSAAARSRIAELKTRISGAGTVIIAGHTGITTGNTAENRALARLRTISTVREMRQIGTVGPFFSIAVGAADPATRDTAWSAQAQNRRVVIILVP